MILFIFSILSCCFIFLSWRTYHSVTPVNLWANDTTEIKVKDVQKYNHSCSKLLLGYAFSLFISGIMAQTQNILMIIIAMLLIVFSSLLLMILYTNIEGKYRL